MNYIDLHVHSHASDGTLSPSEVVQSAYEKGLAAFALTDHDTVDGIPEALSAAKMLADSHPGSVIPEVIPGVELSALYLEREIHILGLFVDVNHPVIKKELGRMREIRNERNEKILRHFAKAGIQITLDELQEGNPATVITRAHFARILLKKGYVSSAKEAFQKYLKPGGPYCPKKERISPERAMSILTGSHAFPALAHPFQYQFTPSELESLIKCLKELGMEGLEVYHSSNSPCESMHLKGLAQAYDLLPTGGSDFHGSNKPDIELGSGKGGLKLSPLLLEDIRRRRQADSEG
ncbi:PHP domain-containing protein [Lachnospiraceae bacterium 62-35]